MNTICPECKNNIDMMRYPSIKEGMIIECNHCGITLAIKKIENNEVETYIVDEGK